MSSSIYEIFHYIPPTFNQCPSTISNSNLSNTSSFFLPLQQPFIPCQLHNITDNYTNHVQLVDSNYLMRAPTHFDCYILLFFARWCQFSVRFAPYFNAIPRAFPGLDFVAYDVSKSLRYMTYFGTNAVPSVFILRKNKLLARLNTTNDIQILVSLIESTLHLNQTTNITINDEDRLGPVTTIFEPSFDYALLFSWLFVGLFIYYYADKYNLFSIILSCFLCRSPNYIMGRGSKNWETHSVVADQPQESSNPIINENEIGKGQYTWEEIRRHTTKTDRWLVIDDRVYDITKWLKHPGGQMLLNHYAGQDASEAFHTFHPEITRVQKYLKPFYIGDVSNDDEDHIEEDQTLKDDFKNLKQKAISKKLFQSSRLFFVLTCFHILAFEFASYFILFRFGTDWFPYLIALVCYVVAEAQCGWVQHDFGHLSVFKKSKWNHLLHQIYIGLTKGASADWWNHMHFQHHSKPNIIDKDPDTRVEPIFVLGDKIPIRAAHRNAKYGKNLPYHLQYLYFFIAAPLLFPVYFQFMTIRHAFKRGKWMDLAWLSLFYIKFFALIPLKLGLFGAIKFLFLIRVFEGTWFVVVTQSNHVVMDVSHDDVKSSWFRMQLKATCNIEKSHFNDWFTGHLNFQIEHHLFPMMPRHNLYKIQADVLEICRKHNIPYVVKPMGQAFYDILTSLEKSGRMWRETYEELMHASKS